MSAPSDTFIGRNACFINSEDPTEMARLMHQDRFITSQMGSLFPETCNSAAFQSVLDLACGPGGWLLSVAHAYPRIEAIGIDVSRTMVEYARAQAWAQGLDNVRFKVMNMLQPLDFTSSSFDFINLRFVSSCIPEQNWPSLIHECIRLLRPGGCVRLIEGEVFSTSPAVEKMTALIYRALLKAGRNFSPDGRHLGIAPMMGHFLRTAHCVSIQHKLDPIDISVESEAHASWYQGTMITYQLVEPFLCEMGVIDPTEFNELYHQAVIEMMSDDFCGILYLLSVWGEKLR